MRGVRLSISQKTATEIREIAKISASRLSTEPRDHFCEVAFCLSMRVEGRSLAGHAGTSSVTRRFGQKYFCVDIKSQGSMVLVEEQYAVIAVDSNGKDIIALVR